MTASCAALCGYHMFRIGGREGVPVCRAVATHVVREWFFDMGDLHLCPSHLAALVKLNPHDVIEAERM